MALTELLITGGAIAVGLAALVWVLRLALALSNGRDLGRAARMATMTVTTGVGASLGLVASGTMTFAEVLDGVTAFIGANPFAVTNVVGLGVGALGLSGAIDLSPMAFVVGGGLFVGATLVLAEVRG